MQQVFPAMGGVKTAGEAVGMLIIGAMCAVVVMLRSRTCIAIYNHGGGVMWVMLPTGSPQSV